MMSEALSAFKVNLADVVNEIHKIAIAKEIELAMESVEGCDYGYYLY